MNRSIATTLLAALLAGTALAQPSPRVFFRAALEGDVATLRRLIQAGQAVDASDRWGNTALGHAAGKGHLEAVAYLLEAGADPSRQESFFGVTVLARALGATGGEPHLEIAHLLLRAGAEDRITALATAFRSANVALAQAAVEAGPVAESEAARLRESFPKLEGELATILAHLKTRPDPPPPAYSQRQLESLTGEFVGTDIAVRVEAIPGGLSLDAAGNAVGPLKAIRERVFASQDGEVELAYFGRAGTVEGAALRRGGGEPIRLRPRPPEVSDRPFSPPIASPTPVKPTVHWPGFRGANRSGVGDGAKTPIHWDLDTGAGVRWSAELPGLGNSSPVVWGGRVFVTTAVAADGPVPLETGLTGAGTEVEEASEHRWLVLAFDKHSGKELWQTEVGRGVPATRRHFKATQANSSPATDGEHLVVVFPTAGLACLGVDGEIHWQQDLGGLNAGGFNDPSLQWGFAASPILFHDRVLLQVDIHDGPYLAAWALTTGKRLWRTERPEVAPSWSTPTLWKTGSGTELVTNASTIHGYDPDDGRELWSLTPNSVQVVASPVVGDGVVYVSAGYPPARPIYALKPGLRGKHEVDPGASSPLLAWSHGRGGAYMPTPLLYRGLLYIVHHNGRVYAYVAQTGELVYRARFSAGGTFTSSPVAANGTVYQGTEEGQLYVFAAGTEYRELAVHDFEEPLMATPAISEGTLFVRTPSRLWALAETGDGFPTP